jgi:UDP-3-O-[3-hydroxymyristoyl] glucosamine N-acyltransferase
MIMKKIKLKKIAKLLNAEIKGNPELLIKSVNSINMAGKEEITFVGRDLDTSGLKAAAVIVARDSKLDYKNLLYVDSPYQAFAQLLEYFFPRKNIFKDMADKACISPEAKLAHTVTVGPFCFIGDKTQIGEETEIHSGVKIYNDVTIGKGCCIYSNVVILEGVSIGDNVVIHAGAIIGADGFGFQRKPDGQFVKIPQKGKVIIEDNCEIGANVCIDRSTIEVTRICRDVKIDNLVQIGHNVTVGESTAISALTGISGSAKIGKYVTMAGQVGIADHIRIADGTIIAGKTGVTGTVKKKSIIAGYPYKDLSKWRREQVFLRNIEDYINRIKELEKKISKIEGKQ